MTKVIRVRFSDILFSNISTEKRKQKRIFIIKKKNEKKEMKNDAYKKLR